MKRVKTEKNFKLLTYDYIKKKAYREVSLFSIFNNNINYTLKRAISVIHKFHKQRKRILFVGMPDKISKPTYTLLKKTKHIFIPEYMWSNGLLTNKTLYFQKQIDTKFYNKKTPIKLLFQLLKKVDLIVILTEKNCTSIVKESYLTKTPTISLTKNLFENNYTTYKLLGNSNLIENSFFYSLLYTVLKRK